MSIMLYALGAVCIFGGIFAVAAMGAPFWVLVSVPLGVFLTWCGARLYIRNNPTPEELELQKWRGPDPDITVTDGSGRTVPLNLEGATRDLRVTFRRDQK